MNKLFVRNIAAALLVLSAGVLFSSCLKDKDNNAPDVPAAGLMAFNLAPDQQSVTIRLSGSSLTQQPLAFSNYTGYYQNIYTGQRDVQSFDYPETTPLASLNFNFEQDETYSLFVVGAGNKYQNIVTVDDVDSTKISSGKAYVRYINAIPDSINTPTVTLASGGTNIANEQAEYTHVSAFVPVTAGDVAVAVKNNGGIDASRTISLQADKAYTVLLIGLPGATDEASKPQIKFIENGSVTTSSDK